MKICNHANPYLNKNYFLAFQYHLNEFMGQFMISHVILDVTMMLQPYRVKKYQNSGNTIVFLTIYNRDKFEPSAIICRHSGIIQMEFWTKIVVSDVIIDVIALEKQSKYQKDKPSCCLGENISLCRFLAHYDHLMAFRHYFNRFLGYFVVPDVKMTSQTGSRYKMFEFLHNHRFSRS